MSGEKTTEKNLFFYSVEKYLLCTQTEGIGVIYHSKHYYLHGVISKKKTNLDHPQ